MHSHVCVNNMSSMSLQTHLHCVATSIACFYKEKSKPPLFWGVAYFLALLLLSLPQKTNFLLPLMWLALLAISLQHGTCWRTSSCAPFTNAMGSFPDPPVAYQDTASPPALRHSGRNGMEFSTTVLHHSSVPQFCTTVLHPMVVQMVLGVGGTFLATFLALVCCRLPAPSSVDNHEAK